jgi:hypothetical protein
MFSQARLPRTAVLVSVAFGLLAGSAILAAAGEHRHPLDPTLLSLLRGNNQNYTISYSDCNSTTGDPRLRDCSQPGTCSGCTSNIFQLAVMGGYSFYYVPSGNGNQCGTKAINGSCDCLYNPDGTLIGCYGCTGGSGDGPCGGTNAPQSQH